MMGPQGTGKGTQAKVLAEQLNFFHWDMGAVLRENLDWKFPDGKTVGEIINDGTLLSDDRLLHIFKAKLNLLPADQGIIFDGIPRRLGQAQFLLDFLRSQGRGKLATIFIDIPREESLKRLLLRAEKEGRTDDTREAIEFRLEQYAKETLPTVEFLKQNSDYYEIDGRPAIPEVTRQIFVALGLAE